MKTKTAAQTFKAMEKFRFDNAYENIYEYDGEANGYVYIGSYLGFGINSAMDESTKIMLVEEVLYSE